MQGTQTPPDHTGPGRSGAGGRGGFPAAAARWLGGATVDRPAIDRSFDDLEVHQPASRRAYLLCAMVWCFFSLWPTTYVEWAGIPLIIGFVVQLIRTPRFFRPLLVQPLFILAAAYWAWQGASLLWTPDLKLGLKQVGCARWMWAIPALWPVMNRRRWLIAALVSGYLAGNLSQLLHTVGVRLDLHALTWPRQPDRNSGWWDPVVGGTLLMGALGLHLPAAAFGAGRWRWIGAAGVAITITAIFVTGTRGAWLAAAALVAIAAVAAVLKSPSRPRDLSIGAVAVTLMVAGVWITAGESISRRFTTARDEVAAYFDRGQITTDTGTRLALARWAIDAVVAHPLGGLGCGGFRAWARERWANTPFQPPEGTGHAHAHNALLHAAATSGAPGALLAVAVVLVALRNARRARHENSFNPYDSGPFWALLGLALVSAFDSIQVNSQTSALFTTLLALSPSVLPRARGWAVGAPEVRA